MRICIVTAEYPPISAESTGGIGSWATALAPALAARGHTVDVLTWGPGPARVVERDLVAVHVGEHAKSLRMPVARTILDLARPGQDILRRSRSAGPFDAVLAPEWRGDAWRIAAARRDVPLFTMLAGSRKLTERPELKEGLRLRAYHGVQDALERYQTTHSDVVVACSTYLLRRTQKVWSLRGKPTYVLPNSIDVKRIRDLAAGTEPTMTPSGLTVAFQGRLMPRKGVHVLAQAMRRIWAAHPDVTLLVIGKDLPWPDSDSRASDHIRTIAGPFADRVLTVGAVPQPELFAMLARATVVATPSLYEPFGIATLEAMTLGVPVIATNESGFLDFVRNGQDGFLVPPGDEAALAEAIRRVVTDPSLRDRLGRSAAQRAEQFDSLAVARQHEDLFADTLARHRAKARVDDRPA